MFIHKIILNNFRIFSGKHEFNFLNKKVIMVEGPNGHGKSTIFDAINWAISGKIARYVGSSEHQQFNYVINSDAYSHGIDEASVEIYFNNEEATIKRVAKKNGSSKLFVNNQSFGLREGQKEIVKLLVNKDMINDTNLIESIDLPSFIESTLILSQENLEEFVRGDKPTQRYSKLEQILGLTRYGQEFRDYLHNLKKNHLTNYENMISKLKDLKHEKELLEAEYQPKLQQNTTYGNKTKLSILEDLNEFLCNLHRPIKTFDQYQHFYEITTEEYIVIQKHIEKIEGELKRFAAFKFEMEQKQINVHDIELSKKIVKLESDIKTLEETRSKRKSGIEKANIIRGKLNNVVQINNYLDEKKVEKEKLNIEIKNISENLQVIAKNLKIDYVDLNITKVSNFIKEYNDNSNLLKRLIDKKAILEYEDQLINLAKRETFLKSENNIRNKTLSTLSEEINVIEKNILDLTNKRKATLDDQIHTLIHEVQTYLLNSNEQRCLVCGTTYNDSKELKGSIEIQINNSKDLLSEFEKTINEYKVKKNQLNIKLDEVKQESLSTYKELGDLSSKIEDIKNKVVVIRLNNSNNVEDPKLINLEIEKLQDYRQNNANKVRGFIEIKRLLTVLEDLKFKKEEISEVEKNKIRQQKEYKHLIKNEKQLKLKLNKIDNYTIIANSKVQEYDKKILKLTQDIQDLQRKIKLLSKIKSELEQLLDREMSLNSSQILNVIIDNVSFLEKEKYEARNLLITIEKYLNDIKLRELEGKIKKCDQETLSTQKEIENYETLDEQLKNLIAHHTKVQSSLVNEYLNGLSLTINNYFRQISPHSYCNYINLLTKKNELFILLNDSQLRYEDIEDSIDESVNASLTLSAAQSTILAMSIFLALNRSQNWSKLNIIGIDDPFQNLDDINAYSFIDVIANLNSVENRQILISTHDSDFAKLSIRKMNLDPEDYAYIKIQSYTREAIEIESKQHKYL